MVWNRPKMGHKGPVRRSTHIDEIPFLAVARSLGDLWSYNSEENVFVVSPEPDIRVYPVDITRHRCLILATDGCWNMLTPQNAISTVCAAERANEQHMLSTVEGKSTWINPSKQLVDCAIDRWNGSKLRADNTSVVTVMLDPPGPPRAQVLKNRKRELAVLNNGRELPTVPGVSGSVALVTNTTSDVAADPGPGPSHQDVPHYPPMLRHNHNDARHMLSSPARDIDSDSDVSTSSDNVSDTSPLPSTSSDHVQCNEISSSEDSPSRLVSRSSESEPSSSQSVSSQEPIASTSGHTAKTRTSASSKKGRASLSRELSSLQLSTPVSAKKTPTRSSTRSQMSSKSVSKTPRVIAKKTTHTPKSSKLSKISRNKVPAVGVQQRVKAIEAKLNSIEKKVTRKTAELTEMKPVSSKRAVRGRLTYSTDTDSSTDVSVKTRSRTPLTPKSKTQTPTKSASKRKRTATPKREITRKSPRTILTQIPKVTHSKQAKVVRLKKQ